jgi:membrane protein
LVERSSTVLPGAATELLSSQLERLTAQHSGALSLGVAFGVVAAIWSVSGAVNRIFDSMNEVYGETDGRPWYVQRAWAMVAAVVTIVVVVVAVGLIALLPTALDWLDVSGVYRAVIIVGRWLVLAALMIGLLGSLYRFGPRRSGPRVPWISVGTLVAVAAWLVMSIAFGIYTGNFGSYNETYGSLGTVVAFMTWLYLSAYIVLMAGELNAELEHETTIDTTVDGDQDAGDRDAAATDTRDTRPRTSAGSS